jgi:hypothetical protein
LALSATGGFPGFIRWDHREKIPGTEEGLNTEDKKEQIRERSGRASFQLHKESGNEGFHLLILFCWIFSGCLSNLSFSSDEVFFIKC